LDFANTNIVAKPAFFAALINLLGGWWRRAGYAFFHPNEKRIKQNAKNGENDQLAKHWHCPSFNLLQTLYRASGSHTIPQLQFIARAGGKPYNMILGQQPSGSKAVFEVAPKHRGQAPSHLPVSSPHLHGLVGTS
jgi:hypothetical protein